MVETSLVADYAFNVKCIKYKQSHAQLKPINLAQCEMCFYGYGLYYA